MGCVVLFWFVGTLFVVFVGGWKTTEELIAGIATAWGIALGIAVLIFLSDPEAI
jgi:hypothetical protein